MQLIETLPCRIYTLRHQRVSLDKDLATLCGVSVGLLHLTVRRYKHQFPQTAMFQLTDAEYSVISLQKDPIETAHSLAGPRRLMVRHAGASLPYVFTAPGMKALMVVLKTNSTDVHPLTEVLKCLQDETAWQRAWQGRERIGFK